VDAKDGDRPGLKSGKQAPDIEVSLTCSPQKAFLGLKLLHFSGNVWQKLLKKYEKNLAKLWINDHNITCQHVWKPPEVTRRSTGRRATARWRQQSFCSQKGPRWTPRTNMARGLKAGSRARIPPPTWGTSERFFSGIEI